MVLAERKEPDKTHQAISMEIAKERTYDKNSKSNNRVYP